MKINIYKIMSLLSKERVLFHSEADFQFSLAWEIKEEYPSALIELERPIYGDSRNRLDILVTIGDTKIPIELKYFVCEVNFKDFILTNKNDSWVSYNYFKDISRIEKFTNDYNISGNREGYSIVIANKPIYWRGTRKTSNYYNYRLEDNRTIRKGKLYDWIDINDITKQYGAGLRFMQNYEFKWNIYSDLTNFTKNGDIRYMICSYTG